MCGYCIESIEVVPFVEAMHEGEGWNVYEDHFGFTYLQEVQPLLAGVNQLTSRNQFTGCEDALVCRLCEYRLLQETDDERSTRWTPLFIQHVDNCGREITAALTNVKQLADTVDVWRRVFSRDLFLSQPAWERVMASDELGAVALQALSYYVDWWIDGRMKETSDGSDRLSDTGIMDPIDDTPSGEWKKFYTLFPIFYFSVVYLWKYGGSGRLLEKVALTHPNDCPDFRGYDLWLQRRAFLYVVTSIGFARFFERLEKAEYIRLELLYYALLKLNVDQDKFEAVADWAKVHLDKLCWESCGVGSDDLEKLLRRFRRKLRKRADV